MRNIQKVLAMLLMLMVLLGLCATVQAEATQPDEAWLTGHLLTEVPSAKEGEFSEQTAITAPKITVKGDQVVVTATPCQDLDEKTVYNVTVNLVQMTVEDKMLWTLDSVQPLSVENPEQERDEDHALPINDDTLTAPNADELAALIDLKSWCDHGETELKLAKVVYTVVTYRDTADTVRARVTFRTADVASAATAALGETHSKAAVNDLQAVFTLVQADAETADWNLSKIQLRFDVTCKQTADYYTVKYEDGCDGQVFAQEVYKAKYRALTPECQVDVSTDELRPGYEFTGWDPEVTKKVKKNVTYTAQWTLKNYTVQYVDGCDGQVFEQEVYTVKYQTQTPACQVDVNADDLRPGYVFAGWDPEVAQQVEKNATYTAQWTVKDYTITYVGVPEGVENLNPTTYTIEETVQLSDLVADGFMNWVDADGNAVTEIPVGTYGDLTLTASFVGKPVMPQTGTNVAPDLLTFQCTEHEEHTWTDNASFGANDGRTYWNSTAKRWETFVYAEYFKINMSQTKKNHFGDFTHYYADDAQSQKIYLYWDADAAGETSLGATVTGQWYAVDGNPVKLDVWCYDKPAAPAKIATYLWVRDWTNTANWVRVNSVVEDTYTVGDVYEENGSFFVDVTINDLSAYISGIASKSTGTYIVDPVQNSGTISYRMKYTGSTTDYKQDGTGWSLYKDEWTKQESNSGKTVWVIPQWTTTYTDGVEGTVFADKVIVYPTSSEGIAQNDAKNGKLLTPSFGDDPVREGYVFTGWDPAVSEKLMNNATYTAVWLQTPVVPSGSNTTKELFKFHCTSDENHEDQTYNWFGSYVKYNNDMSYNAERKVFTASATLTNVQTVLYYGTSSPEKVWGQTHYHTDADGNKVRTATINLVWDPTATGLSSTGKETTGMWMPDGTQYVNVYCYDKPAAPQKSSQVKTSLWIRDWTKVANYVKATSVVEGSYTLSEMYGNKVDGFYIDVTITDLSAYISTKMAAKTTGTYKVDPVQNTGTITYRLKYTGSTSDYKQDGSGWTVDKSDWTSQESNNGKIIWVIPQWTTTYTDGADGSVFENKTIVYPVSSEGIAQDVLKSGSLATPAFGDDPVREGFIFTGWDPAVSEKLTNSVIYTAQWEAVEEPAESESPAPEVSETPSPEVSETPAPDASETPAPEVSETPAPDASEEPAPAVSETPAPEVSETPAPDASETPAPDASEEPAPEVSETPAPEVSETPANPDVDEAV